VNDKLKKDLEGSSCGLILRDYPGISLEVKGLRETTKNPNHDSRSSCRCHGNALKGGLSFVYGSLWGKIMHETEDCSLTHDLM
jgi:hypothetical protein